MLQPFLIPTSSVHADSCQCFSHLEGVGQFLFCFRIGKLYKTKHVFFDRKMVLWYPNFDPSPAAAGPILGPRTFESQLPATPKTWWNQEEWPWQAMAILRQSTTGRTSQIPQYPTVSRWGKKWKKCNRKCNSCNHLSTRQALECVPDVHCDPRR